MFLLPKKYEEYVFKRRQINPAVILLHAKPCSVSVLCANNCTVLTYSVIHAKLNIHSVSDNNGPC